MARLIFARHGESTANLSHTFANRGESHPLTALGRTQAEDLVRRLESVGVTRLFASPLLRARQTADIVARRLGVAVEMTEALREFDVGRWEGSSDQAGWDEYAAVHERWLAGDDQARVGGGESLQEIRGRVSAFVRSLVAAEGTTTCISHGGLYRAALPGLLVNVSLEFALDRPFQNAAWVEATEREGDLWCVEWCGEAVG